MTRDEIVAVCQREADAWNAHDPAAIALTYARHATVHDGGGATATGREEIAARAKGFLDAFPDMRVDVASIEVDGDTFTWEWRAAGTNSGSLAGMSPTNKPVIIEGCSVGKVGDDGLTHSANSYWNEASMMRQLGLMPEPAIAG